MRRKFVIFFMVLLIGTSTIVTADNEGKAVDQDKTFVTPVGEDEIVYNTSMQFGTDNQESTESNSEKNLIVDVSSEEIDEVSAEISAEEANGTRTEEENFDPIESSIDNSYSDEDSQDEAQEESAEIVISEDEMSHENSNEIEVSKEVIQEESSKPVKENEILSKTENSEVTKSSTTNNVPILTREDLQPNEIFVSNFEQLKGYIELSSTHTYNKFRFTNDIVAKNDVINVPDGYSFTISGLSPLNGVIYSYIELNSTSVSNTIQYNHQTPITVNIENIKIEGKNPNGTINVSDGSLGTSVFYNNVSYNGPQVVSNSEGIVSFNDSVINIISNGSSSKAQRTAKAKHVEFTGTNEIVQTSTDEPVFKMGDNNSITFKSNSNLTLKTNRGMNEITQNTKVTFEDGSNLTAYQSKNLDNGALFFLNGEGSEFKMLPGSNLSLTRKGYTTSTESIISTDYQANVTLDNSVLAYVGSGIQKTNGLIKANTLKLTPGTDLTFRIDGDLSIQVLDVQTFNEFNGNVFKVLVNGSLNNIGIMDYVIQRDNKGELFSVKDSEITVEAKDNKMVLIGGGGIEIINSKLVFDYSNNIIRNIFYFDEIKEIRNSEINLSFNELAAPFLFSRVGVFQINDSKIKVVGNVAKDRLIWARDLRFNNQNSGSLDIELSGNVMSEVIRVDKQLISNKQEININTHGEIQKGPVIRAEDDYTDGSLVEMYNSSLNFIGSKNSTPFFKSDILNLHDSKINIQSQFIESPQINTKHLMLENSEMDIVGVQSWGTSLIETSGLKLIGSNLHLDSGIGDQDTLILMRKGELSVDKNSKLALVGPYTKSLVQTMLDPVTITFEAEQINQWGNLGIDMSKRGFDNMPTYRYLPEGDFSTLKFIYVNNTNTMETIDYRVDDFVSQGNTPLNKTFSLFNAKTKVLSVGYSRFPVPVVPAGSTTFTAQADPESHIRMRYHSDNILKETEALAGVDGQYTMITEKIGYQPVHFDYYFKYFYGYDFVVYPEETGSLRFGSMPTTISYGQPMIPKKQTVFNRESQMNLGIIDDRSGGVRWKLEIEVTSDIYDELGNRENIPGNLVFKDERGIKVLEKNQRYTVAEGDGNTSINEVLNYTKDKGLLLRIDDGSTIYLDGEYTVDLKWILSDNG